MKKYIFFAIFVFSFILPVYASANYDTNFNFSIPNYDNILNQKSCGNTNMKDFVHNFIDLFEQHYSTDYTLHINLTNNNAVVGGNNVVNGDYELIFKVYPKAYNNRNRVNFSIETQTSQGNTWYSNTLKRFFSSINHTDYIYSLNIDTCNANPLTSSTYQAFLNLLGGGVYNQDVNSYSSFFSSYDQDILQYDYYINLNINDNTDFDLPNLFNSWIYYSSVPINFNQSGCTGYCKALHINNTNTTYQLSDTIPTYWDIRNTYPEPEPDTPSFLTYRNSIDTIYTNLSSSSVSNYNLQYSFDLYTDSISQSIITQNYVDNLKFNFVCSTRDYYKEQNDTTNSYMYMYKNVPCSLSYNYLINDNKITYIFNNLSIDTSLLSDKIYITINSVYENPTLSYSIHNVNYIYTLGDFYNTTNKGNIYESFSNLPINFNLFVSGFGDTSISNIYLYKPLSTYNVKYNTYSISDKMQKSSLIVNNNLLYTYEQDFLKFNTTLSNNTGLLIYQIGSNNISLPKLDLFFNQNIGLSFSSNQEDFYYYVDNGIPSISIFIPPIPNTNDVEANFDDTNINNYLYKVNSFISSLNNDCLEVANLTQTFYNGIPVIFQSFIFILFILFCTYFLYVLIRK